MSIIKFKLKQETLMMSQAQIKQNPTTFLLDFGPKN